MSKREIPEINAGSMADIAFLLLIFFLVTTTIAQPEAGQPDELPYPSDFKYENKEKILDRNVLFVLANRNNALLLDQKRIIREENVDELYDITLKFFGDHTKAQSIDEDGDGKPDYPVREQVTLAQINADIAKAEADLEAIQASGQDTKFYEAMLKRALNKKKVYQAIGSYYEMPKISIIKFESDNGTSYGFYVKVMDQMNSALNDLRNKYTQDKWGVNYDDLDEEDLGDQEKINIVKALYPNKIIDSTNK